MKRHILRFHPIKKEQDQMIPGIIQEKKKSLTCSFCFERFENNANLTEHIAATHCKTFTKRTLPKTFPQKSTILDAEKSEKPKSKIVHLPLNLNLPLNLENLPSNLNLPLNLDNLPLNLDSITSDRKDVDYYRCSTCPRRFLIESDLEKHKIEHDQKSHFCPYCGNCYAHKCHLTQHVNTKHEPYECLQCFRRFTEKVNLTEHINSVHKIKKEQKNVPNPIVEIQPSDIKKEKQDQDIKSKIVHLPLNLDNLPLNLDNDRKYVKTKMPEQGLKKQVTCTLDLVTLSVSAKTVITKSLPNLKIRKAEPKVENIETEVQQFEPEVIIKEESEDFLQE
jgi:DNA-directed RNA polymerase subunit RPC12/RpoP